MGDMGKSLQALFGGAAIRCIMDIANLLETLANLIGYRG